jgi:hypothetical protein
LISPQPIYFYLTGSLTNDLAFGTRPVHLPEYATKAPLSAIQLTFVSESDGVAVSPNS